MFTVAGILLGFSAWLLVRVFASGFYTVEPGQRVVKTSFGRALRVHGAKATIDHPVAERFTAGERERYVYPQVQVVGPGGPYFKMPWQKLHPFSVATKTMDMASNWEHDPAQQRGSTPEAVTKDQLNIGLKGQIRYRVSEDNPYAFLFGIKEPIVHVMAYFLSVLRQKIANFEAPRSMTFTQEAGTEPGIESASVSINDIRKNLRDLNEYMDHECSAAAARYGVVLDASLITGIDPPTEIESALAAINTAHNQVMGEIALAQAGADRIIVESRRAVEIEMLKVQAEVEPLRMLAAELCTLDQNGHGVLSSYVRNVRQALYSKVGHAYLEVNR